MSVADTEVRRSKKKATDSARYKALTPEQRQQRRERNRINMRAYYARHKAKLKSEQKAFEAANPDKAFEWKRRTHLKRRYKITLEEYEDMFAAQGGRCAICGDAAEHIDHDHTTGKVRGLLCRHCNYGLGQFRDSPERLAGAIKYLGQNNATN